MKLIVLIMIACGFGYGYPLFGQDGSTESTPERVVEEEELRKDALEEILQGHSYHGDAFNEGPRQRAYLMGGTGNVKFPVTTESEEAQAFINQGVGQLHGFWYLEAERSFRQAAAIDPSCAMAYWGAAVAAYSQRERAQGFIAKAVELKEKVSKREQMYIDAAEAYFEGETDEEKINEADKKKKAAAYLKALETIVLDYPDDLEAKAFVAHRIWYNNREGVPISSYLAADALIREIYLQEPLHPSHHFTIHLWDYRKPEKAVASAARCGIAAPGIAHMWHMPGHIYSRLKRYEDAVYQQEASARVDHAHMMRDRVMPDEISNFAHNNEWLIRNLVFIGRVDDAIDLAENMISLPRHPKYNTLDKRSGSASHGRRRLLRVLREYQLYERAIQFCQSAVLHHDKSDEERLKTLRLLGCSAAITNRSELAEESLQAVREILGEHEEGFDVLEKRKRLLTAAEKSIAQQGDDLPPIPVAAFVDTKTLKEDAKAARDEFVKANRIIKQSRKAMQAIEAYGLVAEMEYAKARTLLLEADGEDLSWLAELHYLAGDTTESLKTAKQQVERRPKELIPLARMAYRRWLEFERNGKPETSDDADDADDADAVSLEDVKVAIDAVREASSSFDIQHPLFARLTPAAKACGYDADWRSPKKVASDVTFRPSLDALGPFRWSPQAAPDWRLTNSYDETIASSDYLGRPHIVIFYLGHGCLHCAEQLQEFGPQLSKFEEIGIEFVAISSDKKDGLAKSIEQYNGDMPFETLVSDESLEVFKKFRVFDDFENQPLHGTFLVDSTGKIRWQDISYEPFMDHEFLLDEAKRLLNQPTNPEFVDRKKKGRPLSAR